MQAQKLLVIDDSRDIHDLVGVWLADEPIELHASYDGASGLKAACALKPDLILLDVDMPGTDGFDVCAQLKRDELTRDIPVVFLTGASDTDEKLRGLDLGAVDYIIKPFEPAELRARVRASLRTKHLLDLLEQKAVILQESEERFRVLAENSSDIISRHNAAGEYLYVSPACTTVLGYSPQEMLGRTMCSFVHSDDLQMLLAVKEQGITASCPRGAPLEFRFLRKDGGYVWLEFSYRVLLNESGAAVREFHGSARDITQRKRSQQIEEDRAEVLEMAAQNRPLSDVMDYLVQAAQRICPDSVANCVVLFDGTLHHAAGRLPAPVREAIDGRLYSFTSMFCSHSTGRAEEVFLSDVDDEPIWDVTREVLRGQGLHHCRATLIRSGRDDVLGMICLYHKTAIAPDATAGSFLITAGRLITLAVEHHQLTLQLARRAQHDALTGLPNRVLFEDRVQHALLRASLSNSSVAVAFIDVDRFKNINDTLGHHAGDVMLCRLAARIMESLGKGDTLARMGGDEFAMILPDLSDSEDAERFGASIIESFSAPLDVLGQELFVTISLGLAMYPKDGKDSITLKKNADAALYAAKNGGRDRVRCFTATMNHGAREKLEVETALRRAIENGELLLHYQPKVDADDRVVGLEALVRWRHPKMGLVPPAQFIPLAEETGLILPIGRWVLNEAARQVQAWEKAGLGPVPVAVNVSAMQFAQTDFEAVLSEILNSHSLHPRLLEIEITESLLMQNMHDARQKLDRLKQLGVTLAIDDFGTGYSSLTYLQRLPIDLLKVDRSFVSVIGAAPLAAPSSSPPRDETTIVRSIAALAHNLGIGLIAEGVETEVQRVLLLSIGCPVMQGFLFSRPLSVEDVTTLIRAGRISRPAISVAA